MPEASEGHPDGVEQVRLYWPEVYCDVMYRYSWWEFYSPKTKKGSRNPGQPGSSIKNYMLIAAGVWLDFQQDQENAG